MPNILKPRDEDTEINHVPNAWPIKLKIVVSEEEMALHNLENPTEDKAGIKLRRSIWRVLDMAKAEVGFDPAGDKVLIQFYPIKSGGCEIFVTKLGILPESSARLVSKSNKISMLSKNKSFYLFSDIEDLLSAVRAIKRLTADTPTVSDVYSSMDKYYLAIEEYAKGGEPMEFPCILEFATALTADFGAYISEHATRLTNGDAIEIFSAL